MKLIFKHWWLIDKYAGVIFAINNNTLIYKIFSDGSGHEIKRGINIKTLKPISPYRKKTVEFIEEYIVFKPHLNKSNDTK